MVVDIEEIRVGFGVELILLDLMLVEVVGVVVGVLGAFAQMVVAVVVMGVMVGASVGRAQEYVVFEI